MRFLFFCAAAVVAFMVGIHTVLQNGSLVRYLDSHPHPKRVPTLEYVIASGYYVIGDLQESATYYQRVAERYPQSPLADDAYFGWLQALDDMNTPRRLMADYYQGYIERFPNGNHVQVATRRQEYCRNAR
jgi:TolA-binding protein